MTTPINQPLPETKEFVKCLAKAQKVQEEFDKRIASSSGSLDSYYYFDLTQERDVAFCQLEDALKNLVTSLCRQEPIE